LNPAKFTEQNFGCCPQWFYMFSRPYLVLKPMLTQNKHKLLFKLWLEYKGEPLIGKGGAEILQTIKQVESISKAAKKTGMSYRYVWNYLAKLERRLGEPVVNTFKGGSKGGGGAMLTELGAKLLSEYQRAEAYLSEVMGEETHWEYVGLKISARNRLKGTVQKVDKGIITAKVKIKIEAPAVITAIISKEAVEELDVKAGDTIEAVIKATEVMVAKEK
jgi:molybdate transport system regulatory protein